RGVGEVNTEQASALGLVGLCARASGVDIDQRSAGTGIYQMVPMQSVTEPTGDCWARVNIRIEEITRSIAWVVAALERFSETLPTRAELGELRGSHLVIAVCESFRGEVVHCLETDLYGGLRHYKVQDPSLRNWLGLAMAVRDNEISDFPICNKSF